MKLRVGIVGGGAAGFFAAVTLAEARRDADVILLERGPEFLSKVLVSGGGRCNVTHACFDARELCSHYPRGGRELLGPFHRFQPRDTMEWFRVRGVPLKTEADGRVFPVTDSADTVAESLVQAAGRSGVRCRARAGVDRIDREAGGRFTLELHDSPPLTCDRVLLATGGCRTTGAGRLAASLGHAIEPPVPSLFTFRVEAPWLRELAGISIESAEVTVPGLRLRERGSLVITHHGVSGPAILSLSAWGARSLSERGYHFPLEVNWLPRLGGEELSRALEQTRLSHPGRFVSNAPLPGIPARLWEALVLRSGTPPATRWSAISKRALRSIARECSRTHLDVKGKDLHRDEFVTCGGVRLSEVDFRTMESRLCPGLYFAGELLDIDGLTGGFNFQAAWTTGWVAGQAMAARY